jgi:hypothetical protein
MELEKLFLIYDIIDGFWAFGGFNQRRNENWQSLQVFSE